MKFQIKICIVKTYNTKYCHDIRTTMILKLECVKMLSHQHMDLHVKASQPANLGFERAFENLIIWKPKPNEKFENQTELNKKETKVSILRS